MSLKLAVYNGKKDIDNMSSIELKEIQKIALDLSFKRRGHFFKQLLKSAVPAFQDSITSPDWLESKFADPIWKCRFGKSKKSINFGVRLEDGSLLTDTNNNRFLYTIKYWLCCQTTPLFCGGNRLKPATAYYKILSSLHIIDYCLLHGDRLQLSNFGLALINSNDLANLMEQVRLGGVADGIYNITSRISQYLKQQSANISQDEIEEFLTHHPASRLRPEECSLDLTYDQLVRAKTWLKLEGAYYHRAKNNPQHGKIRMRFFSNQFYAETLHGSQMICPNLPELSIAEPALMREFYSVPVQSIQHQISHRSLSFYETALRSMRLLVGSEFVGIDSNVLDDLDSFKSAPLLSTGTIKRNRSLPAPVAFKAMRDAFEFSKQYADDILSAVSKILIERQKYKGRNDKVFEKLDAVVPRAISGSLKNLGVLQWAIAGGTKKNRTDDFFQQLRNNVGLYELYCVLIGCIQIIIGILMARRVGELIDLTHDCLVPVLKDPTLEKNKNIGYSIIFDNRKSGEGEEREKLTRPITLSGAKLIWKLRQFRQRLQKIEGTKKDTGLFLSIDGGSIQPTPIAKDSYSNHLDTFCDYFQTRTIALSDKDVRRYYLRQHQLRRFFAMSFFWGSGYEGLDTLRWFLGHTDAEHLWHYITENTPGVVLRSAKAETLVHGLNANKIEGIERLRELLKERFDVSAITIESLPEALDDLEGDAESGYIETEPEFESLLQELETDIDILLAEGLIDLEPTFCTITTEDGKIEQKVTLVLIVKEIDDAI